VAVRFGDCELSEERFELRRSGRPVAVEPKVLQLLLFLVRHRARAVTRAELLQAIWPGVKVGDASLTRAVVEARRAIADDAQEAIVTVRGHGFRFAAPVVDVAAAAAAAVEGTPGAGAFFGREAPMAALGAQLESVAGGGSAFAWITGVAGIGKTRLAEEIASRARARGVDVHVARGHEAIAQPAYRPWITILEAIGARPDPEGATAREAAARLAAGGADIGAFDVVMRALAALGRARARLLLFDDVHWADEGTLELLRFVTREARDAGLFVVCTLRETPHAEDARSRALGRLLCEYGGVQLPLRGLSREATAQLVHALLDRDPSDSFVSAVQERTGGCPLFVRQILDTDWARRALDDQARTQATSIDLRRGLVDSVSRHLEGVSAECRDALEQHYAGALDLHAAETARHFVRAAPTGAATDAYEYCRRAARHAAAKGDLRAAAKHWSRAMGVLDLVPGSEGARLEALLELARAHAGVDDGARAREALLDAAMLARALDRPDALAEATLDLARLVPRDEASRLLDEARAAVARTSGPRAEALVRRLERALD
jgi:DNA-binding winged helix-turn-helix (wHTH) protein